MRRTLVLLAFLAGAAAAYAGSGPPPDVAARARGAGKVVVARITDVHAHFEINRFGDQLIVSDAVLEVLETWKGQPESSLEVAVEGGTVGELTLRVSDMPSLSRGERAVFFLDSSDRGMHTPNGRGQGILQLDANDNVEGSTVALDDLRQRVRNALGQGRGGR